MFDFVDAFRRGREKALVDRPPVEELPGRLQALLASTVEALCAELALPPPTWCAGIAGLAEPWFVSGIENLKAMAIAESPVWFRKRGIFVLANFLDRA